MDTMKKDNVTTTSTKTGFFKKILSKNTYSSSSVHPTQQLTLVDVGGEGDCGFRSVAAGIMDNVLSKPQTNQKILMSLLERHTQYFPLQLPSRNGLKPIDQLQQRLRQQGTAKTIRELAFTLRQLAVDELCEHAELYRGAFVANHENTTPIEMRKSKTWIDESAIAALATKLQLPITVNVVEKGKELPMRLQYGPLRGLAEGDKVTMQLHRGHYMPKIAHPERFDSVCGQTIKLLEPMINNENNDPDLNSIFARIKQHDAQLVKNFEQNYHRLITMVEAEELNKDELLAIYIKGMESSDYLQGRIKHVGIEHGNQRFFEDAINNTQRFVHMEIAQGSTHDEQITQELIHAIARAISIGQLDENNVFAEIDQHEKQCKVSMQKNIN